MVHARALASILLCLLICFRMGNCYDLPILSCKSLVHHIQFKMLIINLEILAPQRGHFAKDVFPQLLLVKPKNVMMLVWEGFYEPLPNHHVNVNSPHNLLFYIHETQYMLNNLDTPSIP